MVQGKAWQRSARRARKNVMLRLSPAAQQHSYARRCTDQCNSKDVARMTEARTLATSAAAVFFCSVTGGA